MRGPMSRAMQTTGRSGRTARWSACRSTARRPRACSPPTWPTPATAPRRTSRRTPAGRRPRTSRPATAAPAPGHLPLILNPDRTKMSKRKSQTAIGDYIAEGFVREAMVNYLALLGWSTGTEEEVLSLEALVERFDVAHVQKAGAVFDRERLEWLNGQWIRRMPPDEVIDRLRPFLEAEQAAGRIDRIPTDEEIRALLPVIQERLPTLGAIGDLIGFLFVDEVAVDVSVFPTKRWDLATTQ